MLTAFAEYEREQFSSRSKEALRSAKKRGMILCKDGREVLSHQYREAADKFARAMQPIIKGLKDQGFINTREITAALNEWESSKFSFKTWHMVSVHALIKRI